MINSSDSQGILDAEERTIELKKKGALVPFFF